MYKKQIQRVRQYKIRYKCTTYLLRYWARWWLQLLLPSNLGNICFREFTKIGNIWQDKCLNIFNKPQMFKYCANIFKITAHQTLYIRPYYSNSFVNSTDQAHLWRGSQQKQIEFNSKCILQYHYGNHVTHSEHKLNFETILPSFYLPSGPCCESALCPADSALLRTIGTTVLAGRGFKLLVVPILALLLALALALALVLALALLGTSGLLRLDPLRSLRFVTTGTATTAWAPNSLHITSASTDGKVWKSANNK